MRLIDPDTHNVTWSPPQDKNPLKAVRPTVDNHIDAEGCIPFSPIELRAKNDCEHGIETLERNGFGSRV